MEFKGKTVFIISYEEWGDMLMSKHHYAIELSKLGNTVYFINHPDKKRRLKRGEINIKETAYRNLFSVENRIIHPYFFKFKFTTLYNFFIAGHIRGIIRRIGKYPEIVWSFDAGNTFPLKIFSKSKWRIYMPVDGPYFVPEEVLAAEKADIVLSVTREILDRLKDVQAPKQLLNHGVAINFINNDIHNNINAPVRIGYAGSLVRGDIDTIIFRTIIASHPDKIFEIWGENDPEKSTIHSSHDINEDTRAFLAYLKSASNVILHGSVKSTVLSEGLKRMDALIVCYNIKGNQSGGTNSHKLLEYLGSGKVIISNNMSTYAENYPGLIEMTESRQNNDELPTLFSNVMRNLPVYNSHAKQEMRINFARQFSYPSQISKVEALLNRAKN